MTLEKSFDLKQNFRFFAGHDIETTNWLSFLVSLSLRITKIGIMSFVDNISFVDRLYMSFVDTMSFGDTLAKKGVHKR